MEPLVSIIMATYNRAVFIPESLQSIQNQSFVDWECLIIDDGSNDNTAQVVAPFLKDHRFSYFLRTNNFKKGIPGCRNFGLSLSRSRYVIFFDDDDIVHPLNLEICVSEFQKNDIQFCLYKKEIFKDQYVANVDNSIQFAIKTITHLEIDKIVSNELPFASCTVMWEKSCFANEQFNENLLYAEEWELYLRIISNKVKGIQINKILYFSRKHQNSNTGEFNQNNSIRVKSHIEAILLVADNLNKKKMLSDKTMRYFVTNCKHYQNENVLNKLFKILNLSIYDNIRWHVFYIFLPIRFYFYKLKTSK